jgi:hypothetical protein
MVTLRANPTRTCLACNQPIGDCQHCHESIQDMRWAGSFTTSGHAHFHLACTTIETPGCEVSTALDLTLDTTALRPEHRSAWADRSCDVCGRDGVCFEGLFALAGDQLLAESTLTKLGGMAWLCQSCADAAIAGERVTLIVIAGVVARQWASERSAN